MTVERIHWHFWTAVVVVVLVVAKVAAAVVFENSSPAVFTF